MNASQKMRQQHLRQFIQNQIKIEKYRKHLFVKQATFINILNIRINDRNM